MNYSPVDFNFAFAVYNHSLKMKTILFIDDPNDILENLTEYFEMEGFKVIECNNGKEGIELAIKLIPDIIICDVLMPEMDGREVLRVLLETLANHKVPFVFSTSLSEKLRGGSNCTWG